MKVFYIHVNTAHIHSIYSLCDISPHTHTLRETEPVYPLPSVCRICSGSSRPAAMADLHQGERLTLASSLRSLLFPPKLATLSVISLPGMSRGTAPQIKPNRFIRPERKKCPSCFGLYTVMWRQTCHHSFSTYESKLRKISASKMKKIKNIFRTSLRHIFFICSY